jgi:pimeloyl-ACP methyl ester carboxylesterase
LKTFFGPIFIWVVVVCCSRTYCTLRAARLVQIKIDPKNDSGFNKLQYLYTLGEKRRKDMSISYLKRDGLADIAYVYKAGQAGSDLPLVMFCGGYRSDMTGTKAVYLQEFCAGRGQAFVRFDYSGHGASGGAFEDGTIGSWADDAAAVLDYVLAQDGAPDKVLIVGSSMGGWIALLLAKLKAEAVCGLIGIAAAPDFTEDMFGRLSDEQRAEMARAGFVKVPNDYSDEPYHYSQHFYEEAKAHLLLGAPQDAIAPMRLIHGKQDVDVPYQLALKTEQVYKGDVEIIFVEDGDHRLSRPQDLELLGQTVEAMSSMVI